MQKYMTAAQRDSAVHAEAPIRKPRYGRRAEAKFWDNVMLAMKRWMKADAEKIKRNEPFDWEHPAAGCPRTPGVAGNSPAD